MMLTHDTKVPDKYRRLAFEALQVDNTVGVRERLQAVFATVPTYAKFVKAVANTPHQSAPSPTGLTYAMMKAWPPEAMRIAYNALAEMWDARDIPAWWKWQWLVPVPKKAGPTMADLRPLTLVEVTRKIWIRLKIEAEWDRAELLHPAQHGFRNKFSTMTATLQYINVLEDIREQGKPIHRFSWDMSKAFDTVSKNAMTMAWLRLGVPIDVTTWLVGFDQEG
eukprot:gene42180-biopygen8863